MLEAGLMEVLANMLARIHRLSEKYAVSKILFFHFLCSICMLWIDSCLFVVFRSTDIVGREEHQICVEDILNLVCVIASREFR
jgi:hypothetical protein